MCAGPPAAFGGFRCFLRFMRLCCRIPPLTQGDHLTLLAVYEGWKNSKFSNPWCYENFVQAGGGCRSGLHAAPAVLFRNAWMKLPHRNTDAQPCNRTAPSTKLQPRTACAAIPAFACTHCTRGRSGRINGVRKQPLALAVLGTSHALHCHLPTMQARSLRRAQDVRKQLVAIMDRYKLDLVSGGCRCHTAAGRSEWRAVEAAGPSAAVLLLALSRRQRRL